MGRAWPSLWADLTGKRKKRKAKPKEEIPKVSKKKKHPYPQSETPAKEEVEQGQEEA